MPISPSDDIQFRVCLDAGDGNTPLRSRPRSRQGALDSMDALIDLFPGYETYIESRTFAAWAPHSD